MVASYYMFFFFNELFFNIIFVIFTIPYNCHYRQHLNNLKCYLNNDYTVKYFNTEPGIRRALCVINSLYRVIKTV